MASLTVTTTPQKLPGGAEHDVRSLSTNTATIWLGTDNMVSSANGVELLPGEGWSASAIDPFPETWVVVASGTADLRYMI